VIAGSGNPGAQFFGWQCQHGQRVFVRRGPDDGNAIARHRQPGQHPVVAKPLACDAAMRTLALEIGDQPHLAVGRIDRPQAKYFTYPGVSSVSADEQPGRHGLTVAESQRRGH
jgi:hypothetical protein